MCRIFVLFCLLIPVAASAQSGSAKERKQIARDMEKSMRTELLKPWYPKSVDSLYGGFLSTFTFDFKPTGAQEKMIVSQARQVWSNSRAAELYPSVKYYKKSAAHGFAFLKDVLW